MKILAIDFGTQKIGLAVADSTNRIAFPLAVIENNLQLLPELSKIICQEKIKKIVVGLPVYQKNKKNQNIYNQVLEFIKILKRTFQNIKIDTQDELLSSQSAQRIGGLEAKQKNRHDLAAMVILEDYLEQKLKN